MKVGEVIRYTLTYTPSHDRILPTPSNLHVRVKNTTAIPYRAAYLVGPYTVHTSVYSSDFTPYKKLEDPDNHGVPQFEPNLKAGGHFHAQLKIPDDIQESGERGQLQDNDDGSTRSATWIIEISSQILFSHNAQVHYELLVSRDERSLDTGFAALASRGHGEPGKVHDLIQYHTDGTGKVLTPKGVYSKAIKLAVQDTAQLWNTPSLPRWPEHSQESDVVSRRRSWKIGTRRSMSQTRATQQAEAKRDSKPQNIHLVMLTHGIHSNIGADMLYLKESIDATVKQVREDSRKRRAEMRNRGRGRKTQESANDAHEQKEGSALDTSTAPLSGGQDSLPQAESETDDGDDEQVIVRGFPGNVTRTEKGIQYLGKRLAKFILTMTYPDQPFLPVAKSMTRSLSNTFSTSTGQIGKAAHSGSSIHRAQDGRDKLPYKYTSISFVGHSLGGLVQLYAIGYIQKHSPDFFSLIKPVNFVTLAAPLLGLSNENPLYIKFALDFGLVGRTGQDLGLTWRAPTIARSGWSAMIAGFGGNGQEKQQPHQDEDPRAKPLLRILPSGPAHHVLKMFKNRTVYANVVNDGIVPLRTSCLLFLDWRGLDRVENARRENGLLGTMAQFGWNELTGTNTVSHAPQEGGTLKSVSDDEANKDDEMLSDRKINSPPRTPRAESPSPHQFLSNPPESISASNQGVQALDTQVDSYNHQRTTSPSRFTDFLNFFRSDSPKRNDQHQPNGTHSKVSRKTTERMRRAQTLGKPSHSPQPPAPSEKPTDRPPATRGDSLLITNDPNMGPPPKTSIFEAANDILNPPIPKSSWITDPDSRSRTIFHDRIYHPEDIPPPPQKQNARSTILRSISSDSIKRSPKPASIASTISTVEDVPLPSTTSNSPNNSPPTSRRKSYHGSTSSDVAPARRTRTEKELGASVDSSGMSVEEKIARAYHRDLSWRKVLVRLEPDAHNNVIVRRMFANAYGWDVVRHICETHFADTEAARTEDAAEDGKERADDLERPAGTDSPKEKRDPELQREKKLDDSGTTRNDSNNTDVDHERVKLESPKNRRARTASELREEADTVPELIRHGDNPRRTQRQVSNSSHRDSIQWTDDAFFEGGESDEWDERDEKESERLAT